MGGSDRNKIWHKYNLGGEDDAQTSNALIAQTKRTISQSTMKIGLASYKSPTHR